MDIKYLYRQIILDHHKNPKNKGLTNSDEYKKIRLFNSSCGDDITIEILVENNFIKDIRQEGQGCSICCSSASVMSEELKGKSVDDAKNVIQEFYNMLTDKPFNSSMINGEALAYSGVKDFPARIGCATLPWKAVESLLKQEEK